MELQATQTIAAPRQTVYEALNDPDVLSQCIPGCETLEKTSDTEMEATVVLKIGPIKARFQGNLEISDLVPLQSYTLTFSGKSGSAGAASGSASVSLADDGESATALSYESSAHVSGKIAQLGGRLINSTANMLAKKFFKEFSRIVESDQSNASSA